MGLKAGIIGLPNVGKSTIFNALTQSGIPADNYPFCTIDPNVGIVEVPDSRLNKLANIFKPNLITPTTIEFVDIAGLVRGASQGEGLGNQFLSHIRDVNAIIHVIRIFQENNITHVDGSINPLRDIETIETELLLRDVESVENRISKLNKTVRTGDKEAIKELATLEFIFPKMNEGVLVNKINIDQNQKKYLYPLSLLTYKPTMYLLNVDESQIEQIHQITEIKNIIKFAESRGHSIICLSGKLESEISILNDNEKQDYLQEYNISEPGLNKLIHAAYKLLNLNTFFTAGEKEVRAWTINKGASAQNAAGAIHSDMEKGFIKAEVYSFDDLQHYKSELALKDAGKIRLEGRNYIMEDGDIAFFKFNI